MKIFEKIGFFFFFFGLRRSGAVNVDLNADDTPNIT